MGDVPYTRLIVLQLVVCVLLGTVLVVSKHGVELKGVRDLHGSGFRDIKIVAIIVCIRLATLPFIDTLGTTGS